MKRLLLVLLTALSCLMGVGVSSSDAQISFSAGIEIRSPMDFTRPLAPFGRWINLGSYGRVWRPGQVTVSWRPYSNGQWVWTDLGWYWVSDEPWAWATYHYGSWVFDSSLGWCWVPGTQWAPAWVSWRDSPDFIGWAPLGPGGVIFAPAQFVFVDIHRFSSPIRPRMVIVNNRRIINRTRGVQVNFRHETRDFNGTSKQVVVNVGPEASVIAKATGTPVTPKPVQEVARETPVPDDVQRSGDIERPVLKEQNVQQWRERATAEGQYEKQPSPTGREEEPKVTPQPQPPGAGQKPEQQKPEQQKPETQPQVPKPLPGEVQPAPTPSQRPLPPTGGTQPSVPEEPTTPPTAPTPERTQPERPTPAPPQNPDQARPEPSTPTPPQQPPPPTGPNQPSVREEPTTTAPTPDRTRPERPTTAPPQNPEQARPEPSTPTPPQQPPTPTGPNQPSVREEPATPPTAPTPERTRPERPTPAPQSPPEPSAPTPPPAAAPRPDQTPPPAAPERPSSPDKEKDNP